MISASPHAYRAEGRERQRSDALLDAAIAQARAAEAKQAPAILTLRHLAFRTGVPHKFLRSVIADRSDTYYREYHIRKRAGGLRRIAVPDPQLMALQRWIVREILKPRSVHACSFAYSRHRSIVGCAARHAGAGWLLKLDIHDFFESISERSVYKVFRHIGYQPLVAFELARLCTRQWMAAAPTDINSRRVHHSWKRGIPIYERPFTGYLPQGAPTSPMLSNLACMSLDQDLADFAQTKDLVFTRYSDDLTFSGPKHTFERSAVGTLVNEVRDILARHAFRMHEKKVSVVPPGGRKVVLGLLVDRSEPRLSRDLRERLSDHVRGIEVFGIASHAKNRKFEAPTGMVNHIAGLLRFARSVEPEFADDLRVRFEAALAAQAWTPAY